MLHRPSKSAARTRSCRAQMEYSRRQALQQAVAKLRVKDIRALFAIMRKNRDALEPDSLFPAYGLTVGEFSTAYIVNNAQRK